MIKSCDRLQALDSCLCLVVFFPSMVFYWRGIWDLFGVYIFPNDAPKCHWVTAGLGACSIVGYYTLPLLSHLLLTTTTTTPSTTTSTTTSSIVPRTSKPVYVIVSRLYMYAFGVLAMAYWRGVWSLADYYLLEFGWKSAVIGLFVCHVILLVLRSTRTTVFPPFVVTLDTRKDLFVPSTHLQTQVNWTRPKSVLKYTLDSLLTHYVIMTATIVTWRSSLSLLDVFLFPNDAMLSNVSSFVIGVSASVLLFAIETPLSQLANHIQRTRRSYWLRLVYEDTVYIVVFAAESFLWRGGWNLNAKFIIADPMVGGWVNHAIGTVLLLSLQLISYAAACGCARDGQDASAGDAIYSTKYLRVFDQYLRERKESQKDRASNEEIRKYDIKEEEEEDDDVDVRNGKVTEKEKESLVNGGTKEESLVNGGTKEEEEEAPLQLTVLSSALDSVVPMSTKVIHSSTRIL